MPRKDPRSVSIREFFGKYAPALLEGEAGEAKQSKAKLKPLRALTQPAKANESSPALDWEDVMKWWPINILRAAARNGDAEGYKRILHYTLERLNVRPPSGVLLPFRWKTGRPEETEKIYRAWVGQGEPPLKWRVLDELAKRFYPEQFSKSRSDPKLRKNLRDRIRDTIQRHGARARKSREII